MPARSRAGTSRRTCAIHPRHAGADVIVAPTYRTSRRALARFGESRRAGEWTAAAVTVAREAIDEAGDRRPEAPAGVVRRDVVVAGSIPPLERFPAEEADAEAFRAHAETIAEAGADLLIVELMGSVAAVRAATLAVASTGLPVWSGAALGDDGTRLESGEPPAGWAEAAEPAEPELLLVYAPEAAAARAALMELARVSSRRRGAAVAGALSGEDCTHLLDLGADVVGLSTRATADALRPLREAIDARLAERVAAEQAARRTFGEWLRRAASWAPAGAALWLGRRPELELPAGFDWTVAPDSDLVRLPEGRYRLAVLESAPPEPGAARRLAQLLDQGGIMLLPAELARQVNGASRVLELADEPGLAIVRRE